MLRDHMITFLETTVVFLLLTNALSIAAATYAIALASGASGKSREAGAFVARKANAALTAGWPSGNR